MSIQRKIFFDERCCLSFHIWKAQPLIYQKPKLCSFMDMDALTFSFSRTERSLMSHRHSHLPMSYPSHARQDNWWWRQAFPVLFFCTFDGFNWCLACDPLPRKPDKEAHIPFKYVTLVVLKDCDYHSPPSMYLLASTSRIPPSQLCFCINSSSFPFAACGVIFQYWSIP